MVTKKLDFQIILHFLSELVVNLYSNCVQKEGLQSVAKETLIANHCSPGAEFNPFPDVAVTVPIIHSPDDLAKCVKKFDTNE